MHVTPNLQVPVRTPMALGYAHSDWAPSRKRWASGSTQLVVVPEQQHCTLRHNITFCGASSTGVDG